MIKRNSGFSLIEVITVVGIIGIVAGIAVPQYAAYRASAYCSNVRSDLANLAVHQEAYFIENNAYLPATKEAGGTSNVPLHFWSGDVVVDSSTGNNNSWSVTASHVNCITGPITYISSGGGFQS